MVNRFLKFFFVTVVTVVVAVVAVVAVVVPTALTNFLPTSPPLLSLLSGNNPRFLIKENTSS